MLTITGCNSTWFYRPNTHQYLNLSQLSPHAQTPLLSQSGNMLNTLYIPATKTNNTLVVHFHGNAGNITWTAQRYGWLRHHGYNLFVFDYSGYGDSTGSPSPYNTWQDAETVLNHVVEQQEKKKWEKIILIGTSLGGNILLHALSQRIKTQLTPFDSVIIDSSFLSYQGVAANMIRRGPGGNYVDGLARLFISDRYAPATYTPIKLPQPVLVTHCTNDRLIPYTFGQQIHQQIQAPIKHMLTLENCEHAQGFQGDKNSNRQQLLSFLEKPS